MDHNIRSENLSCIAGMRTDHEGSTCTSKLMSSWVLSTARSGLYFVKGDQSESITWQRILQTSVSQVSKPVCCVSEKCLPCTLWCRSRFSCHAGLRLVPHCHRKSPSVCHQAAGAYAVRVHRFIITNTNIRSSTMIHRMHKGLFQSAHWGSRWHFPPKEEGVILLQWALTLWDSWVRWELGSHGSWWVTFSCRTRGILSPRFLSDPFYQLWSSETSHGESKHTQGAGEKRQFLLPEETAEMLCHPQVDTWVLSVTFTFLVIIMY